MQGETNLEEGGLTKVVLARKTEVAFSGDLDPLQVLETLQARSGRMSCITLMESIKLGHM